MRDCESIRESIGRWLDGELDTAEGESIRAHLASCQECRKAQQQLESIHQMLKTTLLAEAQRIAFLPFWRGVQVRIAQKTQDIVSSTLGFEASKVGFMLLQGIL